MPNIKENPAAGNGGAITCSSPKAIKSNAKPQDLISFWLYQCCFRAEAYSLLNLFQYSHEWIKYGDLGGVYAVPTGKFFEPHEHGSFFVAQAVWYDMPSAHNEIEEPLLFDIIAWHPEKPRQWYFLRGEAGLILGEKAMFQAAILHEPLLLHSSPLAWLRSGCKGCVLLDYHGLGRLYGLKNLICEDAAHGARIEQGMTRYHKRNFPRLSFSASREAGL